MTEGQPSSTVLQRLLDDAVKVSRAVVQLLECCERGLAPASDPASGAAGVYPTGPQLLASRAANKLSMDELDARLRPWWLEGVRPKTTDEQRRDSERKHEARERLAALVLQAWEDTVRSKSAARPDVLGLTIRYLTTPQYPHLFMAVRYAIVSALRTIYGLQYDVHSVGRLRTAHAKLARRLERQQTIQIERRGTAEAHFLIDLLCVEGCLLRSLSQDDNRAAYYEGFGRARFGIVDDARPFSPNSEHRWPQLFGEVPDFPEVLKQTFGQPLGIPGLDEILGGILPALPEDRRNANAGGQIALVAGRPGTGKTSLCLAIASRAAELGASARYMTMEEDPSALELKLLTMSGRRYLAESLWPEAPAASLSPLRNDLSVIDGREFESLEDLYDEVQDNLDQGTTPDFPAPPSSADDTSGRPVFLAFPRVLVIDSLTVLVHLSGRQREQAAREQSGAEAERNNQPHADNALPSPRRILGDVLLGLRRLGVSVFLVGGPEDHYDQGLAYLVDSVFLLETEPLESGRSHRHRSVTVDKTRLQTSHRGRHMLHLSRSRGISVNPSLHSVIRRQQGWHQPHRTGAATGQRIMLLHAGRQLSIPAVPVGSPRALPLASTGDVLVHGFGSTGKGRLALAMALAPQLSGSAAHEIGKRLAGAKRKANNPLSPGVENAWLQRARILVVSFLYEADYYERIVDQLLDRRYGINPPRDRRSRIEMLLDVRHFYPGFIDPETLVARVGRWLESAKLEGRPYTSVVLDGLHNIVLQFPVLEREPLLWPSIYALFRRHRVGSMSTFTFFQLRRTVHDGSSRPSFIDETTTLPISPKMKMLFHLLVSGCDYNFEVVRAPTVHGDDPDEVQLHTRMTIDGGGALERFGWSPGKGRFLHLGD